MFCFYPTWRMHGIDFIHGSSEKGVFRVRAFLNLLHMIGSTVLFLLAYNLTGNSTAALIAGVTYAVFSTAPAFSSESFNWEQIYVPLIITGFYFYRIGPDYTVLSGICFGLAVLAKISTGVFFPGMIIFVFWEQGPDSTLQFAIACAIPVIVSHTLDWSMGYFDGESRKQFQLRLAATVRCSSLKQVYGSISRDILLVIDQTLPLWLFGTVGLPLVATQPEGPMLLLYAGTTILMILCQRGFSRYHYFPLMSVWAILSAIALDAAWKGEYAVIGSWVFSGAVIWSVFRLGPFYLKPLEACQLAQYEKYDQFLYLPRLGKLLKRWFRLYGRPDDRLFVWGNYVQLYHMTEIPASDQFVHYALGPWDDRVLAGYFDTVIGGLLKYRPYWLVRTFHDFDVGRLREITGLDYRLAKVFFGRFPIYRLKSFVPSLRDPLTLSYNEKLQHMEELTRGEHVPGVSRLDEERGRLYKALTEFRKLTKINPWDHQGLFALAELCERLGKIAESARAFERLIALHSKRPLFRLRLAKIRLDGGMITEAENLIEAEANLFGETVFLKFHRGLLARARGQYDKAVDNFQTVLKVDSDRHECRFFLAEMNREKGSYSIAINGFQELWDRSSSGSWMRTQAALGLAECHARTCKRSETLLIHHERDPGNETLAYALASSLESEGEFNKAHFRFSRCVLGFKQCNLKASAFFRLARLSLPEERDVLLRKCLHFDPTHEGARKLLTPKEVVCRV
tara:strand:- start:6395 stop:8608 length:2214 start_codon:yes stop_codon:yes gene_type:complete